MYACIHTHEMYSSYIYMYMYTHVFTQAHTGTPLYIHTHIHTGTPLYTHTHTYRHTIIHTYTHTHIHTHTRLSALHSRDFSQLVDMHFLQSLHHVCSLQVLDQNPQIGVPTRFGRALQHSDNVSYLYASMYVCTYTYI